MTDDPPHRSVLDGLESFVWDSHQAAAYEAAVEAINAAVGAYSARIATEEQQRVPDNEAINQLRAERAKCAQAREQLDPADPEQIAEVRRHYSELARSLRDQ